jgi:hypothetical protein
MKHLSDEVEFRNGGQEVELSFYMNSWNVPHSVFHRRR